MLDKLVSRCSETTPVCCHLKSSVAFLRALYKAGLCFLTILLLFVENSRFESTVGGKELNPLILQLFSISGNIFSLFSDFLTREIV